MLITDTFTNYDKSKLFFNGDLLTDITKTFMAKGKGEDVRYNGGLANTIGIKQHDWTNYILRSVETISKMAAEASKEGNFSLVCDVNQDFFDVFARTLYHQKGIKVKKVDNVDRPKSMLIKWGTDNSLLHPAPHFTLECRKNNHFIDFDFTIKGLDRTFPCHKLVVGWKSSFLYKGLTSPISNMKKSYYEFPEGTFPQTVEVLLSYLYDEKKDVSGLSPEVLEQLLEHAGFFELNQLKWFCKQELIKHAS